MAWKITESAKKREIVISEAVAAKLCALSGGAVKLYIYLCSRDPASDADVRAALGMTEEGCAAAGAELVNAGLAEAQGEPAPPEPERRLAAPSYTREEVVGARTRDPAFAEIVREAEKAIKPFLTDSELRVLLTVYAYWGMPADCFIIMLRYLSKRDGALVPPRRPTIREAGTEAQHWLDEGIITTELADRYIEAQLKKDAAASELEKVLGLSEYQPYERNLIRSWAEMGFGADAVAIARDISAKSTGGVAVRFINQVIRVWREAGISSPQDIKLFEARRAKEREAAAARTKRSAQPEGERQLSDNERQSLEQIKKYMSGGADNGN